MLIDWPIFATALVLLLPPIAVFHGQRVRYRHISRDWDRQWSATFLLPHHLVDLLRAAAGAWLLAHSITRAPEITGVLKYAPEMIHTAVILCGVLLQTLVCKEPDAFNAPFTYLVGVAAGFLPPLVAGFALVFAIAITAGARSPATFFVVLPMAVVAAGALFTGKKMLLTLAPVVAAALTPWLFALLFGRDLVFTQWIRAGSESDARLREPPPR